MKRRQKVPWGRYLAPVLLCALMPVAPASFGQSRSEFGDPHWMNGREAWVGTFTLPFEVRWGNATLPSGDYRFSINSGGAFGRWISINGAATNVSLLTVFPVSQCDSQHKSLFVANVAGERRVYMLHLADAVFTFAGSSAEKELSAREAGEADCDHLLCCRTAPASDHQHTNLIERIPVSMAGK